MSKAKYCFLDFEFNKVSEKFLNLVSVSSLTDSGDKRTFWLYNCENVEAVDYYSSLVADGHTFVAFSVEAECRSLMMLVPGIDWVAVKWIDLYLEYRCLLNQNHKLAYGKQLIDGKVKTTNPPVNKWKQKNVDTVDSNKPSYSLAAACFKLLGVNINVDEKDRIRGAIIRDEIEGLKDDILRYNESDVIYLPALMEKVISCNSSLGVGSKWETYALRRGKYAALTANMVSTGYPINREKVASFVQHIPNILKDVVEDCIRELSGSFQLNKKTQLYVRKEAPIKEWVRAQNFTQWKVTDKGDLSLSKKAFGDWFNSTSDGFGGAFYRYLKTKESLNGFLPGSKNNFFDFVGSDSRVRPYFGIYGSQTSRSQPGATAFIPLKSHWMRNFIEPSGLNAIVGIDYSSQEFLIAALLSQDKAMIEAYESGDVYLAFAKKAGIVPESATKSSHKRERDICKSFVLGISYEMGPDGLARKMTQDTGSVVTRDEAENLIKLFRKTYARYASWKESTYTKYLEDGKLFLPDGWAMWKDNDSRRSVLNYPVQGTGACVMREAVRMCHESGIKIIFTLHDALYAEMTYSNFDAMRLFNTLMIEAFDSVFKGYKLKSPIRTEGIAWSKQYRNIRLKKVGNIELLEEYIDDKCVKDLDKFRQYFTPRPNQP